MTRIFISHSSQDDTFVRNIRSVLADYSLDGWIDSRELRGGDPLRSVIQQAIDESEDYAVVISTNALQSEWVSDELEYALKVQKKPGKEKFRVIALLLDGTKIGAFKKYYSEEPFTISVSSSAGGVEAAMHAILVATGKRLPGDVAATAQPKADPLEELVLELTDLKFFEKDGVHRASARARLVYEPATSGQREVTSVQSWRFVAPLGPIEAEDLRWYLEKYAVWPSHYFQARALKVEENLVKWGKLLYDAAMPLKETSNVMQAWAKIGNSVGRRFSVHVNSTVESGAPETDVTLAKEAATLLLGLPWELLYDGDGYLIACKPRRGRHIGSRDGYTPTTSHPFFAELGFSVPEWVCGSGGLMAKA